MVANSLSRLQIEEASRTEPTGRRGRVVSVIYQDLTRTDHLGPVAPDDERRPLIEPDAP